MTILEQNRLMIYLTGSGSSGGSLNSSSLLPHTVTSPPHLPYTVNYSPLLVNLESPQDDPASSSGIQNDKDEDREEGSGDHGQREEEKFKELKISPEPVETSPVPVETSPVPVEWKKEERCVGSKRAGSKNAQSSIDLPPLDNHQIQALKVIPSMSDDEVVDVSSVNLHHLLPRVQSVISGRRVTFPVLITRLPKPVTVQTATSTTTSAPVTSISIPTAATPVSKQTTVIPVSKQVAVTPAVKQVEKSMIKIAPSLKPNSSQSTPPMEKQLQKPPLTLIPPPPALTPARPLIVSEPTRLLPVSEPTRLILVSEHSRSLSEHSRSLSEHSRSLSEHSRSLSDPVRPIPMEEEEEEEPEVITNSPPGSPSRITNSPTSSDLSSISPTSAILSKTVSPIHQQPSTSSGGSGHHLKIVLQRTPASPSDHGHHHHHHKKKKKSKKICYSVTATLDD